MKTCLRQQSKIQLCDSDQHQWELFRDLAAQCFENVLMEGHGCPGFVFPRNASNLNTFKLKTNTFAEEIQKN